MATLANTWPTRSRSRGRVTVGFAVRRSTQFGKDPQRGTDGPDPDCSYTDSPLRRWFRLFPVGIWRRHRHRRYFVDRACGLLVGRTRKIVAFPPPAASVRQGTARRWSMRQAAAADLEGEIRAPAVAP